MGLWWVACGSSAVQKIQVYFSNMCFFEKCVLQYCLWLVLDLYMYMMCRASVYANTKIHLIKTWKDKMTTYKQLIGIHNLVAVLKLLFRNLFHKCSNMRHLNKHHHSISQHAHPPEYKQIHSSGLCLQLAGSMPTTGSTRWIPHHIAAKHLTGKFYEGSIFWWEKPSDSMSLELCQ